MFPHVAKDRAPRRIPGVFGAVLRRRSSLVRRKRGLELAGFWLGVLSGQMSAAPLVYIRSTADSKYEAARAAQNPPKDETYVFYQGKFFGGQTVDRTLERMPFIQVAQFLAPHLKKQHYVPVQKMTEADLILVIHWGATVGKNRADALASYGLQGDTQMKLLGAAGDFETASAAAEQSGASVESMARLMEAERRVNDLSLERAQAVDFSRLDNDLSAGSNAALLGLSNALREENQAPLVSTTLQTINAMLDEDRYFIIMVAYDRRALVNDKVAKRMWSARINMRSAGVNFREAVNYFGKIGENLFGKQSDRMVIQEAVTSDQPGKEKVLIGELKVIEPDAPKR